MSQRKKKVLKIVIIVIAILALIWMLGIRLLIWFFAQDAFYVGPAAEYFTEYEVALENTQSVSHNGVTISIPSDYTEAEPLGSTIIYQSPDQTESILILASRDCSDLALFGEENVAKMSEGFLSKIGAKQLMKGFKALGNGFPDTYYTTYKSLCLLTADDYSFLNWKQGFAYVVSKILADAWLLQDGDQYLYETENICGLLQISDNMHFQGTYTIYAYMYSTDDLNTEYTIIFKVNSLEDFYGMINSMVIE